ncbi:MAG: hypothetical protein ACRDZW_05570, partial [Acidimicrobiales bacterium]
AVGPIMLTADLRAGRISAAVDVDSPREGKQQTRVNWLLRQLKAAPDSLRVDCFALHARGASTSELLKVIRESPAALVDDPKREIRTFRLILSAPMGTKRGQGRGGFVTSVLDLLNVFYEGVVQGVKPWAAAPPKLRPDAPAETEPVKPASLASTSLSSQDGAQPDGTPGAGHLAAAGPETSALEPGRDELQVGVESR